MRAAFEKIVRFVRRHPEASRLVAVTIVAFALGFFCRRTPESSASAQSASGICRVEDVPNLDEDQKLAAEGIIREVEFLGYQSFKITNISKPAPSNLLPNRLGMVIEAVEKKRWDKKEFPGKYFFYVEDHRAVYKPLIYNENDEKSFREEYGF